MNMYFCMQTHMLSAYFNDDDDDNDDIENTNFF